MSISKTIGYYLYKIINYTKSTIPIFREFLLADRKECDNSAVEIQADLSEIERDLTLRRLLWESQEEWDKLEKEWTESMFENLNVDLLQKNVNRFTQTVYMLEKGLPSNDVVPRLKEMVMSFKLMMPVITSLRNAALKMRHWDQIESFIGRTIIRDKSFTLGNLLEMNVSINRILNLEDGLLYSRHCRYILSSLLWLSVSKGYVCLHNNYCEEKQNTEIAVIPILIDSLLI